jgi:glycine cleavage system transcriptional repressor
MPPVNNALILTALGKCGPDLLERLTKAVLDQDCAVRNSRISALGGSLGIIMLVQGNWNTLAKLENALPSVARQLGLAIQFERTEEYRPETEALPYQIEVVALNHPASLYNLMKFFAQWDTSIEHLVTNVLPAPHTGAQMFSLDMIIAVPASIHVATLRDAFLDLCDSLNLDAVMEPVKL